MDGRCTVRTACLYWGFYNNTTGGFATWPAIPRISIQVYAGLYRRVDTREVWGERKIARDVGGRRAV